ncbi:sodium:proton antiporter [candidate division GN15 bacterium]|nr:sodium:proton antiporter [candidate division GN15 bacterium]
MSIFTAIAVFICIAALASYLNYRFLKLPATIGLMVISLSVSLLMILLHWVGVDIESYADEFLASVDFGEALMQGMLSFLLFAGALKINLNDLEQQKFIIGVLATAGVVVSTFVIGSIMFYALALVGLHLPYIYCLLFGALISPTDPVAVLALLKTANAPRSIATKIAGESLFNDGVGVVVFITLLGIAVGGHSTGVDDVLLLLAQEALGGVVFGLAAGYIAYLLLKDVDDYIVEVLITLALVVGGYGLAMSLHLSGPIAIVVAGLLIGNHGRRLAMSEHTRHHLDTFWELIDEILNAVLFVWIGFEVLILAFTVNAFFAGLIAIPVVLGARLFNVWAAVKSLTFMRQFSNNAVAILTWGGLRGGISIALALSIPTGGERDVILSVTYVVVVFSILVQGLTIRKLIRRSV